MNDGLNKMGSKEAVGAGEQESATGSSPITQSLALKADGKRRAEEYTIQFAW